MGDGRAKSSAAPDRATKTEASVREWLVATVAGILDVSPAEIEADEPLTAYGLGSTEAVMLTGELEDWLGRDLPSSLPFEYPSISEIARYVADPDVV